MAFYVIRFITYNTIYCMTEFESSIFKTKIGEPNCMNFWVVCTLESLAANNFLEKLEHLLNFFENFKRSKIISVLTADRLTEKTNTLTYLRAKNAYVFDVDSHSPIRETPTSVTLYKLFAVRDFKTETLETTLNGHFTSYAKINLNQISVKRCPKTLRA